MMSCRWIRLVEYFYMICDLDSYMILLWVGDMIDDYVEYKMVDLNDVVLDII